MGRGPRPALSPAQSFAFCVLRLARPAKANWRTEGPIMTLPLEGVRVVALEQAVAGPLCTRHLADLGADVVKIERTEGGDFARRYDSFVKGEAAHFVWLNR